MIFSSRVAVARQQTSVPGGIPPHASRPQTANFRAEPVEARGVALRQAQGAFAAITVGEEKVTLSSTKEDS